jgi:hypothetical protein
MAHYRFLRFSCKPKEDAGVFADGRRHHAALLLHRTIMTQMHRNPHGKCAESGR